MARATKLIAILVLLCASAVLQAQSWSNILASSRAVSWTSAGLPATFPDSETTTNPWTPPTRTQSGSTITCANTSADATTINNALAAAASGTYVLIGSGTCDITTTIAMYGFNNVTLRGSGPMATFFDVASGVNILIGKFPSTGTGVMSSSYAAGTTSITVTGVSTAPVANEVALINQCDTGSGSNISACTTPSDNGSVFVCGDTSVCTEGQSRGSTYSHEQQAVRITNVVNNGGGSYTLTISPGLYMPNWSTSLGAQVSWDSLSNQVTGLGLEDLTIYSPTNSSNFLIQVGYAYASWIKGLRILGTGASFPVKVQHSKNVLVFNNYCAANIALSGYNDCYSVDTSSDFLVLNNIAAQALPTEYDGNNSGGVTAYNFGRDGFTLYTENIWAFNHAAFDNFDLYEGDESGNMTEDDIWGTAALNTYFRNYIVGFDTPYTGGSPNPRGLTISNYHRFINAVGNVIGSSQITSYQGTGYGTAFQVQTNDALTGTTFLRWGNVTNILQSTDTPPNSGVRFVASEVPSSLASPNTSWENPVPSNNNLPCSFFLTGYTSTTCTSHPSGGTGLSWWKVCITWTTFPTSCSASHTQPFPFAGPDVTGGPYVNGYTYDNPAAIAWLNLPIDTTYQNSYCIASSNWSSGTETVTIGTNGGCTGGDATGLPTGSVSILGPFQISGTGSGTCTTGPNSECYITSSSVSTNTISYALASNPGSIAGGTVKFPDIRKFDERVYENDTAGASFTVSPTTIPAHHSGHITLTLTGSGTSWNGSTTFTFTGVTGIGLVSCSNSSATAETCTVTTGSGTGTASLNDTTDSISANVTVATATLAISPASGNTSTTPTLTLTGTNTLWASETASGLFSTSGSGCSGESIGTPTVSSNTVATAVLTTGSASCTITVTDTSTTATAAFTVSSSSAPDTVTTTTASSITGTSAVSGGSWTCTGTCSSITSEGVCYGASPNPTTPCTSNGTSTPFTSNLSALTDNTLYYYRAFAANSVGTTYGSDLSFTTSLLCGSPVAIGPFTSCGSAFNVLSATAVTVNYSPIAGNGVELFVTYCPVSACASAGTPGTPVISDNLNNPETCFTASPNTPFSFTNSSVPDYPWGFVYYCPNIPAGINSFTVTATNAVSFLTLGLMEWKAGSIASSGYFETVDTGSAALGNTPVDAASLPTSATTVRPVDLVTGMIVLCGGTIDQVVGSGYTGLIVNPGTNPGWLAEAKAVSSAGIQTATSTWTPAVTSGNCNLSNPSNYDTWYGMIAPLVGPNSQGMSQLGKSVNKGKVIIK